MRIAALLLAAAITTACSQAGSEAPTIPAAVGTNAVKLKMTPIAEDLAFPWSIAVLPGGEMLVTEREGAIRVLRDGVLQAEPISGAPQAYVDNQGGYLGLALDPEFETNRIIYLSYSAGNADANRTTVVRGVLDSDLTNLSDVQTIFQGPEKQRALHFGGRLEFLGDGTLLVALGDGFKWMDEAQNTANYFGKIARINTDGTIPTDNPFTDGAAPGVYSYGHRNVQGLEYDPASNRIWAHEHGPKGGDELNVIEAGNNYGWPEITYGVNYNGSVITTDTEKPGMEQPVVKWVPSIAPSGLLLYTGDKYPGWQGDMFVGGMNGPAGLKLVRIDLDGATARGKEDLLVEEGYPIRDVVQGADGFIYVATHEATGGIYRLDIE